MKAYAKKIPCSPKWRVVVEHGCQRFHLDYNGTEEECRWMARMFGIALAKHDEEQYNKIDGDDV